MSEILIDASNVLPDILLWLWKSDSGYFIERRINREHVNSVYFKISENFARQLLEMDTGSAGIEMERYVMYYGGY